MLTFVVPIAPYHEAIAEYAVASCLTQTLLCSVVVVYDHDRRGAGWARNRGLEQVKTPFVSFLDADDWIEPDFAEKMLKAYDGKRYCYSDWIAAEYVEAPCRPWNGNGAAHIVTTLLPTAFVRYVGGFDEALPGNEDADFYWKLTRASLCGKRLPEALFHYGKGGQRAQAFKDHPDRDVIAKSIIQRYEGMSMPENCGGCGGGNSDSYTALPAGAPSDGDVLAQALWAGNRQERGRSTGRLYPRTGNGKQVWVSPADIDAAPHLFARVVEMPARVDEADLQSWRQLAGQLRAEFGGGGRDTTQDPAPSYAVPGEVAPDVGRVLRLYQQNVAQAAE